MKITLIAAMAKQNRVIGNSSGHSASDQIPWKIPKDMQHFRQTTQGHMVIMGMNTFKSISLKPLKNRINIVLSRQEQIPVKDVTFVKSIEEAINNSKKLIEEGANPNVFIIGGAEIYKLFLGLADNLILTLVEGDYEGDVFFPVYESDFEIDKVWQKDTENGIDFAIVEYKKPK